MRSLRNGLAIVQACRGLREQVRALMACVGYAVALAARGRSKPYVTTLVVDGLSLTLDWAAAEQIPVRETLTRHEYAPDPSWLPQPADVVVDVGANAGVFALDAARRVGRDGRVIAVEPNPGPRGRLVMNTAANGCEDRVTVVDAALGEKSGRGTMLVVDGNTTTGRVVVAHEGDGDVRTITLDELAASSHIDAIDLLKIDVEGAELEVLKGGAIALERTRRVVLEVEHEDLEAEVRSLLAERGLTSIRTIRAGPDSGARLVFATRA